MHEIDATGGNEDRGADKGAPGGRPHPAPGGVSGGAVWLLRPEGGLDRPDHPVFMGARQVGRERPGAAVIVDLSRVREITAEGVRGLLRCARTLSEAGGRLLLAGASDDMARLLRTVLVDDTIRMYATVAAAVAARGGAAARADTSARDTSAGDASVQDASVRDGGPTAVPEVIRLRRETVDLRARLRSHPLIAQAQGVLWERYRLPAEETAFTLLKRSSQTHNVKLRTLAAALLRVERPAPGSPLWFPERNRGEAPALPFLPDARPGQVHRSTVVKGVLNRAMEVVGSDIGDLQLADPAGLRMEQHHGLGREFIDYFSHVGDGETACSMAAARGRPVVSDIATDRVFSDTAREIILATGSRTAHSIPMTGASREVVGVFSVHVPKARHSLTDAETAILLDLATRAGLWLEWHERTVVLDALEDLHRRALAAAREAAPRRPSLGNPPGGYPSES
ncbi:ANTAR domain-containing protein [Streptomyces rugosispiralis]|uniref:ANTAR domain-containing protein n=1 Tax=Streptomyces rugosispiralis TaxID=2967341 RepID=A0ABT1VAV8_9ACTN|nr:ANTAR domain-containing protein [Streptomyces rugosispiralis]MCQ8194407.1 ANTAR domain-containing protein [Streptomyces rugosispiralis]